MRIEQTPHNPNIRTVIAPDRGAGVSGQPELSEQTERSQDKTKRKLIIGLGAGAAGIALAAGAVFGISSLNVAPKPRHSNSASADPSKTPEATATRVAEVLTVASLEVPAGASPEQLGITFFQDRLSAWEMAGATPDNQKAYFTSGGSVDFINSLADKNGNLFADALLVPNWRDDPSLATWVANEKKTNASYLENWFLTYKSGIAGDTEAFKASTTVDSTTTVLQTDMLKTIGTEHNNADKNRIGSKYDPQELTRNGEKFTFQYALQTIDGKEKISALQ